MTRIATGLLKGFTVLSSESNWISSTAVRVDRLWRIRWTESSREYTKQALKREKKRKNAYQDVENFRWMQCSSENLMSKSLALIDSFRNDLT